MNRQMHASPGLDILPAQRNQVSAEARQVVASVLERVAIKKENSTRWTERQRKRNHKEVQT